jgi:hypothetical protein
MQNFGPWTFGWTQLLTLIGFALTLGIAIGGFRTFGRWKREKVEEKRIEIALDALSLAYQAQYVFDGIRSPMSYAHEWEDMPKAEHETEESVRRRGPFFAILKRIESQRDFFQDVWKLCSQTVCSYQRTCSERQR